MENLSTVSNLFLDKVLNDLDILQQGLQGRSILCVDDEYVNFLYFSELLSGTGATILRAFTCNQALTCITLECKLCLVIISESFVNRMNYQIVSQIKNIAPGIPVIGIIGTDNEKNTSRFLQIGCDLYLSRYIDNVHLIEMINELLESSNN